MPRRHVIGERQRGPVSQRIGPRGHIDGVYVAAPRRKNRRLEPAAAAEFKNTGARWKVAPERLKLSPSNSFEKSLHTRRPFCWFASKRHDTPSKHLQRIEHEERKDYNFGVSGSNRCRPPDDSNSPRHNPGITAPIGIGGRVTSPPLPHHRTCGSASGGSDGLSYGPVNNLGTPSLSK